MSRRSELLPFSAFAFLQPVELKPPDSSAPVQYGTSLPAFINRSAESMYQSKRSVWFQIPLSLVRFMHPGLIRIRFKYSC